MDRIDSLPVDDSAKPSPDEKVIIENMFDVKCKEKQPMSWKALVYSILLFVFLGNPYVDAFLSNIPKCDSPIITTLIKVLLFGTLLLIAMKMF